MFGVMGDGNMFFVDSFIREHGGAYVAAANEAGAVLMAVGYASASGHVGVATVTHGPGLANTVAALVSATRDRAPIVLLTGDTAAANPGNAQKMDQASFVAPTGAGFESMVSAASGPEVVDRAMRRAWVERRPIVVNAPVDFNFDEVDYVRAPRSLPPAPVLAPDPDAMDVAVGIMATARRPIVLAGRGAIGADAPEMLQRLGQVLGAPLATTLPAKALFGPDPYDLGVFGTLSSDAAVEAIMASDCIIAAGAGLNQYTGGGVGWPYLRGKQVVHCDLDPAAIGGQYAADAPVLADVASFARTAVEWLEQAEYTPTTFRDAITSPADAVPRRSNRDGFVDLIDALAELNRVLPAERSVTVDGGRFTYVVVPRIDVPGPQSWCCSFAGFAAIGNGLATALGVGCARPDAPTVAFLGDGGFMLGGLAEFNTAVRHGIDLIAVVCNDASYGAEYAKLEAQGYGIDTSLFEWPEFAAVADALGGTGYTIRGAADLEQLATVIGERDRPLLIDLKLDPATVPHTY
jgi:thiamine pyrophosphate-dependent acetolactate synthase large subunit-like protein